MENSPRIIMRCPKCSREFDAHAVYCETCSAMLEPFEAEEEMSPGGLAAHDSGSGKPSGEAGAETVGSERIDDVKIETLKADIESMFVTTLLLEREQLRDRLARREKAHEAQGQAPSHPAADGRRETSAEEILKRIARLEAILENLRKKIEADIAHIEEQAKGMDRPGLFWFLTEEGKYRRMLFSELDTKKILLGIILKKHPSTYFRDRELRKIAIGVFLVFLMSLVLAWGYFRSVRGPEVMPPERSAVPAPAPAPEAPAEPVHREITEKDIRQLLEDIRNANLKKDFDLWASRYTKEYLEGRKEGILEQWKKYDYTALEYQIGDLKVQGDSATAVISWEIDLFEKKTGWTKATRQRLQSTFTIEDGRLRIASVVRQ